MTSLPRFFSPPLQAMRRSRAGLLLALLVSAMSISCYWSREEPFDVHALEGMPCRQQPSSGYSVRWVECAIDYHRAKLAGWCETVGPPVVEIRSDTSGSVRLDSLAVLSWNAYIGGGDVVGFIRQLRQGAFTGGRAVEHFVVFLQEVYRSGELVPTPSSLADVPRRKENYAPDGSRWDIVSVADQLNLSLFYTPSMRNGPPGSGETEEDRGNAILSTLPLFDLTAIELPLEIHRRVAVAATVRGQTRAGDPWQLRVSSAHLDHRSAWLRFFTSVGPGRLRQGRALAAAIPETPAVLGGDFNTWSFSRLESTLKVFRRAFAQTKEHDDRTTVEASMTPDRRVDYIFFRLPEPCSGTYRRLDDRFGSDHWPLLGWVPLGCMAADSSGTP